jgi:GT2 family glycosyltransferase
MGSVADIGRRPADAGQFGTDGQKPDSTELVRTFQGWNSPHPITATLQPGRFAELRAGIARDLDLLLPRCEALDRALPPGMLHKRAYVASKQRHDFALEIGLPHHGTELMPASGRLHLAPPVLRTSHAGLADCSTPLANLLGRVRSVLVVGEISVPSMDAILGQIPTTRVAPGDGCVVATASGQYRPAVNAFSSWLANHDERERAEIGAIALGRSAGRVDVDLLRRRLYGHQRVLVEAGSPALTWLLAQWDGSIARDGDVIVFAEPGPQFRVPSLRTAANPASWPRISIVTVSFNQHDYLEQCLRSVLDQRYPNLEFIVIDAGSTDGSIDILRRYASEFAHLVIEPDEGQSDGLNKGFRLATGDILTWVNSDDMLEPLSLYRAAIAFAETGADMVAGTCTRVAGVGARRLYRHHSALPTARAVEFDLGGPLNWCSGWEKGDYFFQPEVFFTRALWERAGGYLKRHLYWAMDWDLWLRCALAGATIVRLPDVLGISREHDAQKTTSDEMYLWQITTILREFDQLIERLEHEAVTA